MKLWALLRKEWWHLARDYRTLLVLFILPLLQLILLGYAMETEPKQILLVIHDFDRTSLSRTLVDRLSGNPLFLVRRSELPASELFARREAEAVLTLLPGTTRSLIRGGDILPHLAVDASDPQRAQTVAAYILHAISAVLASIPSSSISATPVFLYNPTRESAFFFVPGITALLILMASALLSSLTITREKESGTFTLLRLSHLSPAEVIGGKLIPYFLLAGILSLVVLAAGMLLFGVPLKGNAFLLVGVLLLYTLTGISMGILVSSVAPTQQSAMLMSLLITLFPTLLLSGFIFPLESMPLVLRMIGHALPATYFLQCLRGIMLKGNTVSQLIPQLSALGGFTLFFLFVGTVRAKTLMELSS
ncbi:ABC-2 type transporter [Spirochaeta thermophila DSM 6578]|uniref:ABC-2 type transporter n=1 Tax=Winmispira thermophila (strain ATCC 700085 / DSM 6578 / Z-1203) TaxID=869211 RepID=G0GEC7_WINT7|nr:ABC transporter permease [Spirochaeta thermophila]AEJ62264.1 ABC-2 type transporter [Spirochaeta thermophila DSM 6578]